jgi:hypothetical protein
MTPVCRDCGTDQLPPSAHKFRDYICGSCVVRRRSRRPKKRQKPPTPEYIARPRACTSCGVNDVPDRLKARYIIFCEECYWQKRRLQYKPYVPASQMDEQAKLKASARRLLRNHIYRGKIQRQPCEVCGAPNAQGHHEDYSKPLEVMWLCALHHNLKHAHERREQNKCAA